MQCAAAGAVFGDVKLIKIVPYKKEHVELMHLRVHENNLLLNPNMLEMLEGGIANTAVVDGRVICAYGINPYLKGVADIWLLPSVYVESKEAVKVARGAKAWLEQMQEDLGLHRMETTCLDDDLHNRWMSYLGFEIEGAKRSYFGGCDYNMWGRIWV